ncbi:MAG: flagellar M-ring protein FliF [Rhodobacteraceae bacterium]|nr:flagellar M-ring protein FliF [Paracoccaceae bacterium]
MQSLLSVWAVLDLRKRIIVIVATLAMFAAVLGVSRMATQPSMSLLYAGLESSAAGDVVKALEARGASYEVRGGAIFVESTRRDELRMNMASEGLPANSSAGYEILDNLSGFGTTSQMFDAAYWRAQEGELARTIVSNPAIQTARVHLGSPNTQGLRQRTAPTASVTVTTSGGTLSPAYAKALKYLVASAVSGLLPENVSVIDAKGGLILAGDEAQTSGVDNASRAEVLRRNVERMLEARVGFGNAVVEISVETVTESESILERRIDPDSRTAISSETEESSVSSTDSRNSGVSVASNLPSGEGTQSDGQSSSTNSETRERTNYEVSETTREVLRVPGAIRRLSVAVLVDGIRSIDDTGQEVWTPRAQEEMASLRDLVASVVGYDETRGDVITLKTLEFEPVAADASMTAPGIFESMHLDVMSLLQLAVLAIVSLVLGVFVLRPILSSPDSLGRSEPGRLSAPGPADVTSAGAQSAMSLGGLGVSPNEGSADSGTEVPQLPALTGEIADGDAGFPEMAVVSDFDFADEAIGALPALGGDIADPVARLRALIEERQSETVEILRGWMENEEEVT